MLQETVPAMVMKSMKALAFVLIIIFKFIIVPYVIPGIRHGIKHGWIFIPLGIIIAGIIHLLLYEAFYLSDYSTGTSHLLALIVYGLFIYLGIWLRRWKINWNKQQEYNAIIIINPDMPDEFYEDDYDT